MTEYYYAKEREESAVERINDSYLEALNSLEKLEAENAELRHDLEEANNQAEEVCIENAKLREELADAPKCETCEAMLDCDECLRADCSHKERRRLSAENAKLRELVDYMTPIAWYGASERERDRMRELGVEQ